MKLTEAADMFLLSSDIKVHQESSNYDALVKSSVMLNEVYLNKDETVHSNAKNKILIGH